MDLAPTDAQLAIQQESRRFLEAEITRERRLTWDTTPEGHDAGFWRAVGQLGWLGFAVPEAIAFRSPAEKEFVARTLLRGLQANN